MAKWQIRLPSVSRQGRQSREAREARSREAGKIKVSRVSRRRAQIIKRYVETYYIAMNKITRNNYDMKRANINFYFGLGS